MRPGQRIAGRFAIEEPAGAGGMGTVYRARDRATGRPVAVKLLRRSELADARRFAREVEALAAVTHPGIVGYVSHGELPGGDPYLVTEWIDGCTLADRLAQQGTSVAEAVAVVGRVADALAAVHRQGLVHRDIKPSNILLAGGAVDRPILIDFGVVRRGDGALPMTATGMVVGTPGYMSPEQARGGAGVDARSDVFVLGCVLHECLTGRPAFAGSSPEAVAQAVIAGRVAPLRPLCPEAPDALVLLLDRMLAGDPAMRPADGGVLAHALAALGPLPDQIRRVRAPAGEETATRPVIAAARDAGDE